MNLDALEHILSGLPRLNNNALEQLSYEPASPLELLSIHATRK